jgi:hypothetical protein
MHLARLRCRQVSPFRIKCLDSGLTASQEVDAARGNNEICRDACIDLSLNWLKL